MSASGIEISLHITHPKENLNIAAKKLSMDPFRIWKAGDKRQTPKGEQLDGEYEYSYCCLRPKRGQGLSATEQIESFLIRIEKHRGYWLNLSLTDGVFSLVFFNEGDSNVAEEIDWKILAKLSALRISLGFDC